MTRYSGTAATDADRDTTAARLGEHYAAGRLSLDQFQDRLDAVYRAQTARELGTLTDSLPHDGLVIPQEAPWGSYPGGYPLNVAQLRAVLARAGRSIMLAFGVVIAGSILVLALLVTAFMVHGGLLGIVAGVLLAILAAGVAAVGALAWLAWRLWRRYAWIEAVSALAGQPWLSRVTRLARLLLTSHTLWRLRTRLASRA